MKEKTVLDLILEFVLGRKYYINIIYTRGVERYEASCFIFDSKTEADAHARSLEGNWSFGHIETISYRSRLGYPPTQRK